MMSSNLMKKYALTTVLLCIIITTFVVTRNKWSFKNDYPPGKAKIGKPLSKLPGGIHLVRMHGRGGEGL